MTPAAQTGKRRASDEAAELVSVVLPTFNRARTLPRAMASVLNQNYPALELIVVDDGSSDDTAQVVGAFSDPRVRYVPLAKNGGASHARNEGMRRARGRYIAFQDSDDEWLAGKLVRCVAAAREAMAAGHGAVTVFHTKILYGRDAQGTYGAHRACCLPELNVAPGEDLRPHIHRKNLISPQALLVTREAFDKVGYFDEDLINNEDWAFGIELFYNSTVVFVDEPLVMTYLQGDSVSLRVGYRAQLRILQKLRKFPESRSEILADHLGRIGWGITKLGRPDRGRRLLKLALHLQASHGKNWARLIANILGLGRTLAAVRTQG